MANPVAALRPSPSLDHTIASVARFDAPRNYFHFEQKSFPGDISVVEPSDESFLGSNDQHIGNFLLGLSSNYHKTCFGSSVDLRLLYPSNMPQTFSVNLPNGVCTLWTSYSPIRALVFADGCFESFDQQYFDPTLTETLQQIKTSAHLDSIDEEYRASALLAATQAAYVLKRNNLDGKPRVMMSDDGMLTLQWRNDRVGAALIFAGDNTVSVAIKNEKQFYSESTQDDLSVDATLPREFLQTIAALAA